MAFDFDGYRRSLDEAWPAAFATHLSDSTLAGRDEPPWNTPGSRPINTTPSVALMAAIVGQAPGPVKQGGPQILGMPPPKLKM